MKISIGLSTSHALISRVIRYSTGSKVSHALTIVDLEIPGHPRMVLEALGTGYVMHPLTQWLKSNTMIMEVTPTGDLNKAYLESLDWLTDSYDWAGLVGMSFVLLGRRMHHRLHNPLNSSRALFCSEAVAHILQIAGTPGAEKLVPEETSPADLYAFFQTPNPVIT